MVTLSKLKKQRKPIKNINVKHQEKLTLLEKVAVWITDRIGTMGFFFIIVIWTILWILWNIYLPKELRFDHYPAFALWLFISNMMQLFFLPLIMISQNLQERHAEMRTENDFEINLKSEKEIETILENLEKQEEMIVKILKKLDDK